MKLFHNTKQRPFLTVLALLAFGAILFALVAPWLFATHSSSIAFNSETGAIGDTFGIMNPFVAIAAALITFAAFWVQYQANQSMLNENRKQQIITRFYEMLKIHRENVQELEWIQTIYSPKDTKSLLKKVPDEELIEKKGRQIFYFYLTEFDLIYDILGVLSPKMKKKERITRAYSIFYYGNDDEYLNYDLRNKLYQSLAETNPKRFSSRIMEILSSHKDSKEMESISQTFSSLRKFFLTQPPFYGHFEELNNYYRHLFLTVKTIADEDEKYITLDEKRNLLRILRAQLSNREQIMLFYNWFTGYGSLWEEDGDDGNHFFTQFRMIHNIMPQLMHPFRTEDEDYKKALKKFVHYFSNCSAIIKFGSKNAPIFEFEEADHLPRFKYDK